MDVKMRIEQLELFNRVRAVLGLKEKEMINDTYLETIKKLVEVIEDGRTN